MYVESKWYLKGIVSFGLLNSDYSCDVNSPAVFTDVSSYSQWIAVNTRVRSPVFIPATQAPAPVQIYRPTTPAYIQPPQPPAPVQVDNTRFSQRSCVRTLRRSKRLIGGRISPQGKWPWVAALQTAFSQRFQGSGSLISQKHVLTAANILKGKGDDTSVRPDDIIVHLGKYNIFEDEGNAVQTTYLRRYYVHPDWSTVATSNFDADLAILELVADVRLSSAIYPVCLWTAQVSTRDEGTVIGW